MRTILNSASVRLLSLLPPLLLLTSCLEDGPQKEPVRLFGYGVPTSLAISPDGRAFISGGSPHLALRDIESGQVRQVFRVGSAPLPWRNGGATALVFSPDGNRLASLHQYENATRLWDVPSGRLVGTLNHAGMVVSAAFTPDGSHLLTVDSTADEFEHQTLQLWDASTGGRLAELERHTGSVLAVVFSADSSTVARASGDGTVRLWNVASGRSLATIAAQTNAVTSLSLSAHGNTVLTGSAEDRVARLWDVERAELRQSFSAGEAVQLVAFTPDDAEVRVAGRFFKEQEQVWVDQIRWFDPETGQQLRVVALQGEPPSASSLLFSPDGSQLVTLDGSNAARLWDVASGGLIGMLNHPGVVASAVFTPDGRDLLTRTGWDYPGVWRWGTATGGLTRRFEGYATGITAVTFSSQGGPVATAAENPVAVWLWDTASGSLLRSFDQTNVVRSMAFSPDGRRLLTGVAAPGGSAGSETGAVWVWDVGNGRCLQVIEETLPVNAITFSPDGWAVLLGCGSEVSGQGYARLRSTVSWNVVRTFTKERLLPTRSVTFSVDGAQVLTGHSRYSPGPWQGEGEANIWNATEGGLVGTLTAPEFKGVGSAVFSPDGNQILIRAVNLHLFDRATGQLLRTISVGYSHAWGNASYLPGGTQILSASGYEERALWDVRTGVLDLETGRCACTLSGGTLPAVVSLEGTLVLAGAGSGAVGLWDIRDTFARLRFQPDVGGTQIAWDTGTLQYAPSVQGPWMDLPTRSPLPLSTIGQQGYFRVKVE